jgi:hypothetical protein
MTQITLSSAQLDRLEPGPALVECRDDTGNLVGYLHVAGPAGSARIPQFTTEELNRYEQEPGGRSLAEILADLRKQR